MKKIVFISCFDWYDNRIKYIEHYFKQYNYKSIIITSDFDHIKKNKIEKHDNNNFIYINTIKYKKNISIIRIISHIMFVIKIVKYVKEINPEIIYALIPPNYLVYALTKIKGNLNFKLIFDIVDLWPESMPIGHFKNTLPFKLWAELRNKNINKADMIILECKHYKKYLDNFIDNNKISILHLIKPHFEYFQNIENDEYDNEYINLCYLGSINSLIDINKIIEIVHEIQKMKKVKVKIIGKGEQQNHFINKLKSIGATVEFYGEIYDEKTKIDTFKDCHFGLNIYKSNISIGLTIKSIDYFQMGLPIINSIKGDTYEMVVKNNLGINTEDMNDEKINLFINDMHSSKSRIRTFFMHTFDDQCVNKRLTFLDEINKEDKGD